MSLEWISPNAEGMTVSYRCGTALPALTLTFETNATEGSGLAALLSMKKS